MSNAKREKMLQVVRFQTFALRWSMYAMNESIENTKKKSRAMIGSWGNERLSHSARNKKETREKKLSLRLLPT